MEVMNWMYLNCIAMIASFHAIYLSVIDIKVDSANQVADVSVKVFTDDLQDAVRNFGASVQASEEQFPAANVEIITKYFQEHLRISVNQELRPLTYVSARKENDAYFIDFAISIDVELKSVEVLADYFMELFPTQSNVVKMDMNSEKSFARLTKDNPTHSVTLN